MQVEIQDERTVAVIQELASRLGRDPGEIVNAALTEAANQYVKHPTLAMMYIKAYLSKKGD